MDDTIIQKYQELADKYKAIAKKTRKTGLKNMGERLRTDTPVDAYSKLANKYISALKENQSKPEFMTQRTVKIHTRYAEVKAAEVKAAEVRAAEVRAAEVKAAEVNAAEVKAAEVRAAEVRAAEVRAAEVKAAEVRAAEVRAAEVRAAEVKAAEVKAAEVKAAEVKAKEDKAAEVKAAEAAARAEAQKQMNAAFKHAKIDAAEVKYFKRDAGIYAEKLDGKLSDEAYAREMNAWYYRHQKFIVPDSIEKYKSEVVGQRLAKAPVAIEITPEYIESELHAVTKVAHLGDSHLQSNMEALLNTQFVNIVTSKFKLYLFLLKQFKYQKTKYYVFDPAQNALVDTATPPPDSPGHTLLQITINKNTKEVYLNGKSNPPVLAAGSHVNFIYVPEYNDSNIALIKTFIQTRHNYRLIKNPPNSIVTNLDKVYTVDRTIIIN